MKRKVSKKQVAFILVAVCLVGLIGIGISYSYYLANIRTSNEENKNSDISSATITQVVMDMQGKVTSDGAYPGHKVVKEVIVRGIGNDDATPANAAILVTPDLGEFANDVTWKLYKSEEAITCSSTVHTEGEQFYEEATCNIPDSATLELEGSSGFGYKNIVVNPNTETKYYLVVEYANKENQNNQIGKSFNIDIGLGEKLELPSKVSDRIAFLSKYDTETMTGDDPSNNIRYIGKNPDNYVYFNCSDYANQTADTCEKWRVIGLFNDVVKGDGSKENLVKIIRDDSLGNYEWDKKGNGVGTSTSSYGSNDWTDSQLMMMLNPIDYLKSGYTNSNGIILDGNGQEIYSKMGAYYYGIKGCLPAGIAKGSTFTCSEVDFTTTGLKNDATRNVIEEVIWNLGGGEYRSATPNTLYTLEKGAEVFEGHATIWKGKIGLMYASDYGYATSGSSKESRIECLNQKLSNFDYCRGSSYCIKNDYLYKYGFYQWILAPAVNSDNFVYRVYSDGTISSYAAPSEGIVRPALFLKSSITIKDGNGSLEEPYQLNLS